ncbi:MAG TPA: hypothetical protein DCO77_10905 [Nitrospiraceae bacterium]|nr:hypothetical protein [Nitrospiraceae bacterium]
MDNDARNKVAALSFIRGMVRYKPAYKIHKKLKDDSGAVKAEKGKKIKLHIRVDEAQNLPILLSKIKKKSGEVLYRGTDMVRVKVDETDIAQLARIEAVVWIEEALQIKLLNDTTRWVIQSNEDNHTKIWDAGLHGEGQIIGIADTGLDYDMPWFYDPSNPIGRDHRKVVGYDPTYGDDYDDNNGHGTHVAGTVGGDWTPVDGGTNANGMAPKSKFFIQDLVFSEERLLPADLGEMLITAYDAGARIHTNSWSEIFNAYGSRAASVDRFMWEHPDFLVLFANGNLGPREGTMGSPATAKNVISVGNAENGMNAENVFIESSHGPASDGRTKPTVTAPGTGIISADSDGVKDSYNSGTIEKGGTSMATPAVAGAAALVRQFFMEGYWPSGIARSADGFTPSAALIKATIVNSAQNMSGLNTDGPIPSSGQGWGRVNLSKSLLFSGDAGILEIVDFSSGLATSESWSLEYYASPARPLKVTLVWTDFPGAEFAAKALVNDLDLTVTAPDGTTTYIGNVFDAGVSVTGGVADRLNVEEQVLLETPAAGIYAITVSAFEIPNGPQPFALVIAGGSSVTPKGSIALDRGKYNTSSRAEITVRDLDLDLNSSAVDQTMVTITSNTDVSGEQVTLTETGVKTGIFVGTIQLSQGPPATGGNGLLEVAAGDTVTADYQDANDGTGASALATARAVIDVTPPVITAVDLGPIADTTAIITWTTDEPTDSKVIYSYDDGGSTVTGEKHIQQLTTAHTVELVGLREATSYTYEVHSADEAGNLTTDDKGGAGHGFETINLPPNIVCFSNWEDNVTYATSAVISCMPTDPSGIASVTIGGFTARYDATEGLYWRKVWLENIGANVIPVTAVDNLGNERLHTIEVTRRAQPDLYVKTVSGPPTGIANGKISITITVRNAGPGDAEEFSVGFYLSEDPIITIEDISLGSLYINALHAGESFSSTIEVMVPVNMIPGIYYLGAIVDYREEQIEADEYNNSMAGNQIDVNGPDLTMTEVSSFPATAQVGGSITVSDTVKNIGLGTADRFDVSFYLTANATLGDLDDRELRGRTVYGLLSNGSSSGNTTVTIPLYNVTPGTYYIGAIADPQDAVKEEDETNNSLLGNPITITE